jgi:hypothetical protein
LIPAAGFLRTGDVETLPEILSSQPINDFVNEYHQPHGRPGLAFRRAERQRDLPIRIFDQQSLKGFDEGWPYELKIARFDLMLVTAPIVIDQRGMAVGIHFHALRGSRKKPGYQSSGAPSS